MHFEFIYVFWKELFLDASISYISLLSGGRGDLKKQTRKTTSKANFALHLSLLPPQPVPGTCCPEHPQHRPFSPSPWAPPGPFSSHSSSPTGKASTGTGGVFGEAPLSSDFHGKKGCDTPPTAPRAPTPRSVIAVCPKRCSCPACRTHPRAEDEDGRESHGLPSAALEEPEVPSPLSAAPGPPPAKALSDIGVEDSG